MLGPWSPHRRRRAQGARPVHVEVVEARLLLTAPTLNDTELELRLPAGTATAISLDLLLVGRVDPDSSLPGLAIVGMNIPPEAGRLQASADGDNFIDVPAVGEEAAFLVPDTGRIQLRFVAAPGFTGTLEAAFRIRAWDADSGLGAAARGITVPIDELNAVVPSVSIESDTVRIIVEAAPEMPVLTPLQHTFDINEAVAPGTGTDIPFVQLLAGISDPKTPFRGIVITGIDVPATTGTFLVSADGGQSFIPLPANALTDRNALLLPFGVQLRFAPAPGFVGDVPNGLRFRAWDGTQGIPQALQGQPFDTVDSTTIRAFSVAEDTVSLRVVAQDATSIPLNGSVAIAPGSVLRVLLTQEGRMTFDQGHGTAALTLLNRGGTPIISATGQLQQHLPPGVYWIQSNTPGSLTTTFVPSLDPLGTMATGKTPLSVARADLNRDGHDDLVVASRDSAFLSIYFGLSSGEFRAPLEFAASPGAVAVELADLNNDQFADLVWVNSVAGTVTVALNDGTGGFGTPTVFTAGRLPTSVAIGDLNGDGRPDIAATNSGSGDVSIFLSTGAGTFASQVRMAAGASPQAALIGDWDGDGRADLVLADEGTPATGSAVAFLKGLGNGSFVAPVFTSVSARGSVALTRGNFDGDSIADLAVANRDSATVSILRGLGNGQFQLQSIESVGARPQALVTGDFNSDGLDDLFVVNESIFRPSRASILLQKAGGGFNSEVRLGIEGGLPRDVVLGDFNRDGRPDAAVVNSSTNSVTVFAGLGDGTFQNPPSIQVNSQPFAIVSTDFNNDGVPDLATANFTTADVSVLIGRASGGFDTQLLLPVGANAIAIVAADLNRDGRPDLAVSLQSDSQPIPFIAILLGLGDGTFLPVRYERVGFDPRYVDVGFINGDDIPDLAVANETSNDVTILLGKGDGTFAAPIFTQPLDGRPTIVRIADFDGDQYSDLLVRNGLTNALQFLSGRGDGTFVVRQVLNSGPATFALDVKDLDADGVVEVILADDVLFQVLVLKRRADGQYAQIDAINTPAGSAGLLVVDVNGDKIPDIVSSNGGGIGTVSIAFGRGDGTFGQAINRQVQGILPHGVAAADFNGDRLIDIAVPIVTGSTVEVLFGTGGGEFANSGELQLNFLHPAPILLDLNRDGRPDLVINDRAGNILFHAGNVQSGDFAARVALNSVSRGEASLGVVAARFAGQDRLVSLDAVGDTISVYAADTAGTVGRVGQYNIGGTTPIALAAGDLNGDGRDDIVTVNPGSNTVSVLLSDASGNFVLATTVQIPMGGTALRLEDVDNSGSLDIVVVSQFGGLVTTILNLPGQFVALAPQRAGNGSVRSEPASTGSAVKARDGSAGIATADFDHDGKLDLVVANEAANSISVLLGLGNGRFSSPSPIAAGAAPRQVRVGDFNEDGWADVAVLDIASAQIEVFYNDGRGNLGGRREFAAGLDPIDFSVLDVNRDGHADLVIGNAFGDVLTINGDGRGGFSSSARVDRDVPLVVADLDGDGKDDLVLANRALDRVSILRDVQLSGTGDAKTTQSANVSTRTAGLVGPGAVKLANLNDDNGDGKIDGLDIPDLVVANSSSNNVLVYFGLGGGEFAAAVVFFAGSRPVGLTISDIDGDLRPDLIVTNQGSNDVSILLNRQAASGATFIPGPRLNTGTGSGPVSTAVMDITGDGVADLVVTSSQSGMVALLPGIGGGFFNDVNPALLAIGNTGSQGSVVVANASGVMSLVAANPQSGQFVFVTDLAQAFQSSNPSSFVQRFDSGGLLPTNLAVADFNQDGRFDLIIANTGSSAVTFFANNGSGFDFFSEFRSNTLLNPSALVLSTDGLQLYCSDEGEEVITVFDLRSLMPGGLPAQGLLAGVTAQGFAVAGATLFAQLSRGAGEEGEEGAEPQLSLAEQLADFRGAGLSLMDKFYDLYFYVVSSRQSQSAIYAELTVGAATHVVNSVAELVGVHIPPQALSATAAKATNILRRYVELTDSAVEHVFNIGVALLRAVHGQQSTQPGTRKDSPLAKSAIKAKPTASSPATNLTSVGKAAAGTRKPTVTSTSQQREIDWLMGQLGTDVDLFETIFTPHSPQEGDRSQPRNAPSMEAAEKRFLPTPPGATKQQDQRESSSHPQVAS